MLKNPVTIYATAFVDLIIRQKLNGGAHGLKYANVVQVKHLVAKQAHT